MSFERTILPPAGHQADANIRLRYPAEKGSWIWHPACRSRETAIQRFVLNFSTATSLCPLLHVTADQRFQLRCNGRDVTFGPDRCDVEHWTVQSVRLDLAPGEHRLEAVVWWLADPDATGSRMDQENATPAPPRPPMAQMSWQGGFLLCAEGLSDEVLNSGAAPWQVEDLTPAVRLFRQRIPHYIDVGPSYEFAMDKWNAAAPVPAVTVVGPLEANGHGLRRPGWCLYPATLPEQRRADWTGGAIRAVREGWSEEAFCEDDERNLAAWPSVLLGENLEVPPQTELTVLWDFGRYRCGYPLLEVAEGRGTRIEWDWAEALYEAASSDAVDSCSRKGHRGEICGKAFLGFGDRWRVAGDGAMPSLWWRSGRYVRLRIATASEPLLIRKLGILETGYPLDRLSEWNSSDPAWDALMPIFENSYRCSAHEQWTDTPYYEQMGYVGDTLIFARSNYLLFGDDRLSRRAIELFAWSSSLSGLVAERYPSAWRQESLTYSMLWPIMVRDFALWRNDPDFVQAQLPRLRGVMAEIEGLPQRDGLIAAATGWPFIDWVKGWNEGCGPGVREGDSSIVNLHWILSLQAAAEVENAHGDPDLGRRFARMARKTFDAVLIRYWDDARGLVRDTVDCFRASEHAQFFALLTGWLDPVKSRRCLEAMRGGDLAQASIYASFYLLDALYQHGEEAEFHRRLAFWRGLPDLGLTATPEAPEPSRSDAHAWGAHPMWHSAASIAGIRSAAPGFHRVRIAPCPGPLKKMSCSVVHPQGVISASMHFADGNAVADLHLPDGISGEFVWRGTSRKLPPGHSHVEAIPSAKFTREVAGQELCPA